MTEPKFFKGKILCKDYIEWPEVIRATFVIGMSDMLNFTALYVAEQHRAMVDDVIQFSGPLMPGALTHLLDAHIKANNDKLDTLVAGRYFASLRDQIKAK